MSLLRDNVVARLRAAGDPERAEGQQRYMKSTMPYHGVVTPDMRRIAQAVFADHPLADAATWEAEVLELWRDATHREQRYVAVELAEHKPYRPWLDPSRAPMIEEMIVTGAWWDFVDRLAGVHMGHLLARFPDEIRPMMWRWATDDDMWRRRTSIIVQLGRKATTDTELLFHAIESSVDSTEFFLRKAIGWALREHSKTDPDVVIDYVTAHADELSGLSKREGLKVVRKQGLVTEIP
jgi:3-methyladenine DNA glycosylase AlkD